jgi:hypothetical protein
VRAAAGLRFDEVLGEVAKVEVRGAAEVPLNTPKIAVFAATSLFLGTPGSDNDRMNAQ